MASNSRRLALLAIPVAALSFVRFFYERALIPLYAAVPTRQSLDWIFLSAIVSATILPIRAPLVANAFAAGALLTVAPNAIYWVAVLTARAKDPVRGPAITHLSALYPLVLVITMFGLDVELKPGGASPDAHPAAIHHRLAYAVGLYVAATQTAKQILPRLSRLSDISDSNVYLALATVSYLVCIFSLDLQAKPIKKARGKSKKPLLSYTQQKLAIATVFLALWWGISPKLSSPVLPHPLKEPYDHPVFPYRVLSSVQSVTGLIVVAEIPPLLNKEKSEDEDEDIHSVRFLRASHSLLGGVWTDDKISLIEGSEEPPLADSKGTYLGDSIYSTFVLQEAVRLVNSTSVGLPRELKNGLIIGLGVGIAATAFHRHAISTTIIEIDPAVYDAARTYFGLPDPGSNKTFIEDARTWAARQRSNIESGNTRALFDFVVHDCFSGGGVPQHVFTLEFWDDIKKALSPDGLVVVNIAGMAKSESSRLIISTLMRAFGHCRAFHDLLGRKIKPEQYNTEFLNIVVFCGSEPLTFRPAKTSDYLGSPLRRHVLGSLPERELDMDLMLTSTDMVDEADILKDTQNSLGKLQEQQAGHHWEIMRNALADKYWEVY